MKKIVQTMGLQEFKKKYQDLIGQNFPYEKIAQFVSDLKSVLTTISEASSTSAPFHSQARTAIEDILKFIEDKPFIRQQNTTNVNDENDEVAKFIVNLGSLAKLLEFTKLEQGQELAQFLWGIVLNGTPRYGISDQKFNQFLKGEINIDTKTSPSKHLTISMEEFKIQNAKMGMPAISGNVLLPLAYNKNTREGIESTIKEFNSPIETYSNGVTTQLYRFEWGPLKEEISIFRLVLEATNTEKRSPDKKTFIFTHGNGSSIYLELDMFRNAFENYFNNLLKRKGKVPTIEVLFCSYPGGIENKKTYFKSLDYFIEQYHYPLVLQTYQNSKIIPVIVGVSIGGGPAAKTTLMLQEKNKIELPCLMINSLQNFKETIRHLLNNNFLATLSDFITTDVDPLRGKKLTDIKYLYATHSTHDFLIKFLASAFLAINAEELSSVNTGSVYSLLELIDSDIEEDNQRTPDKKHPDYTNTTKIFDLLSKLFPKNIKKSEIMNHYNEKNYTFCFKKGCLRIGGSHNLMSSLELILEQIEPLNDQALEFNQKQHIETEVAFVDSLFTQIFAQSPSESLKEKMEKFKNDYDEIKEKLKNQDHPLQLEMKAGLLWNIFKDLKDDIEQSLAIEKRKTNHFYNKVKDTLVRKEKINKNTDLDLPSKSNSVMSASDFVQLIQSQVKKRLLASFVTEENYNTSQSFGQHLEINQT